MSSGPPMSSAPANFKPEAGGDPTCQFPRCACPDPQHTCEHVTMQAGQARTIKRAAVRPDPRGIKNAAQRRVRKQRAQRASRRKNRGR